MFAIASGDRRSLGIGPVSARINETACEMPEHRLQTRQSVCI